MREKREDRMQNPESRIQKEKYEYGPQAEEGVAKVSLTQVSCVGAHRRAPYNPLTNRDLWAHVCAPLHASIKIKPTFATPSEACGSDGADEAQTEPWALAHGPGGLLSIVYCLLSAVSCLRSIIHRV